MQDLEPTTSNAQPPISGGIETEEFQIDMVDFGPAHSYTTFESLCVCGCVCGGCAGPFCACFTPDEV